MVTIVGAGAAGLSLAMMVDDPWVIEATDTPGGLCRSVRFEGWTYDTGPHILGGDPAAVAWIRESTGIRFVSGRTNNAAWIDGEWQAHPFARPSDAERYSRKLWKGPAMPLDPPTRRPGGVAEFLYPQRGGYQAITDAWYERLRDRVMLGSRVNEAVPGGVWAAPVVGRYNTLALATMAFTGARPRFTAVYLPGAETPWHRLSFPCSFSPENAPKGTFLVQAEMTVPGLVAFDLPPLEELGQLLRDLGLSTTDALWIDCRVVPFAYPCPGMGGWREAGVRYHGRSAGRRYLNLDGVVAASMALAGRLR
jgi:hypothetical protein